VLPLRLALPLPPLLLLVLLPLRLALPLPPLLLLVLLLPLLLLLVLPPFTITCQARRTRRQMIR
jgi:hypothetical protein